MWVGSVGVAMPGMQVCSADNQELVAKTPTMKVKRAKVLSRYSAEIEVLYGSE
jgi:long-subunit acyl-CoA synthetase (AMP-forming)